MKALILALVLALTACGGSVGNQEETKTDTYAQPVMVEGK